MLHTWESRIDETLGRSKRLDVSPASCYRLRRAGQCEGKTANGKLISWVACFCLVESFCCRRATKRQNRGSSFREFYKNVDAVHVKSLSIYEFQKPLKLKFELFLIFLSE